jgi:hypothetical protein
VHASPATPENYVDTLIVTQFCGQVLVQYDRSLVRIVRENPATLNALEDMVEDQARLTVSRLPKSEVVMALGHVIGGINVVAIHLEYISWRSVYVFRTGMAETAGRYPVFQISCLAGSKSQVVGGVVYDDISRSMGDERTGFTLVQSFVYNISRHHEGIAEN